MVLLKHGAMLSLKNAEGKTPLDCAQSDTMQRFIQDYEKKGPSVFPGYKQFLRTTEGVAIKSFPSERRGSAAKVCIVVCFEGVYVHAYLYNVCVSVIVCVSCECVTHNHRCVLGGATCACTYNYVYTYPNY